MPSRAMIGLGGNVGDRSAALEGAVAALAAFPEIEIVRVSDFIETEPVGGPPRQGPYLNAALEIETTLDPIGLLRRLQVVESRFGRVRTVRWGERTLDLDLLLFDDLVLDSPELTVPHPRMTGRRFVLEPLAEIAPTTVIPGTGRTVTEWLDALPDRK